MRVRWVQGRDRQLGKHTDSCSYSVSLSLSYTHTHSGGEEEEPLTFQSVSSGDRQQIAHSLHGYQDASFFPLKDSVLQDH